MNFLGKIIVAVIVSSSLPTMLEQLKMGGSVIGYLVLFSYFVLTYQILFVFPNHILNYFNKPTKPKQLNFGKQSLVAQRVVVAWGARVSGILPIIVQCDKHLAVSIEEHIKELRELEFETHFHLATTNVLEDQNWRKNQYGLRNLLGSGLKNSKLLEYSERQLAKQRRVNG